MIYDGIGYDQRRIQKLCLGGISSVRLILILIPVAVTI